MDDLWQEKQLFIIKYKKSDYEMVLMYQKLVNGDKFNRNTLRFSRLFSTQL